MAETVVLGCMPLFGLWEWGGEFGVLMPKHPIYGSEGVGCVLGAVVQNMEIGIWRSRGIPTFLYPYIPKVAFLEFRI